MRYVKPRHLCASFMHVLTLGNYCAAKKTGKSNSNYLIYLVMFHEKGIRPTTLIMDSTFIFDAFLHSLKY